MLAAEAPGATSPQSAAPEPSRAADGESAPVLLRQSEAARHAGDQEERETDVLYGQIFKRGHGCEQVQAVDTPSTQAYLPLQVADPPSDQAAPPKPLAASSGPVEPRTVPLGAPGHGGPPWAKHQQGRTLQGFRASLAVQQASLSQQAQEQVRQLDEQLHDDGGAAMGAPGSAVAQCRQGHRAALLNMAVAASCAVLGASQTASVSDNMPDSQQQRQRSVVLSRIPELLALQGQALSACQACVAAWCQAQATTENHAGP
ncbi:hypothetical protein HaLaN_19346, partial [Haematococcus lacustris]